MVQRGTTCNDARNHASTAVPCSRVIARISFEFLHNETYKSRIEGAGTAMHFQGLCMRAQYRTYMGLRL